MRYSNYHTHTIYSDGTNKPIDYVKEAINKGITMLGFSEHSPLPFDNNFSIKSSAIDEYVSEINKLKIDFSSKIGVLCSFEADYVKNVSENFKNYKQKYNLDYIIGSVHLVGNSVDNLWFIDGPRTETYDSGLAKFFDNNIQKAVKSYWFQINEMIENEEFDIIGHLDKITMHNKNRYFSEDEKWYSDCLNETLNLIKEKELIVEINTRGIYKKRSTETFPSSKLLKLIKLRNIDIMLNSDAHSPNELVLQFDETIELIKQIGFKHLVEFDSNRNRVKVNI